MTLIPLILCAITAWMPVVDGQRVGFGYHEPSYWLGISFPPTEFLPVSAVQDNVTLFTVTSGTHFKLSYIDSYSPITFYEGLEVKGYITPEPTTLWIMSTLTGMFYANRNNKVKKKHRT